MKVTYVSPNSSHHYHYALGFKANAVLHAFISGWPRYSKKSRSLGIERQYLKKNDFFMSLYLLSLRLAPAASNFFATCANQSLDLCAYPYAIESDVFLFYRTTGVATSIRLKKCGSNTICIVEEVNSHVLYSHQLILEEYLKLGMSPALCLNSYDTAKRLDAYQVADYILVPSSFAKRSFVSRGYPDSKVILNIYGMAKPAAPTVVRQSADRVTYEDVFRVLYVGQLNIRKGLRYLVEAFKHFRHPRKELWIVGPATPVTGLENTTFTDEIQFKGVLKGISLLSAYKSSSVFVLPSVEEGLALVQGEALASGLPIIATTHSGAEDIITHGVEGFIVEPCDASAITGALQELADKPELLQQMRNAALSKAETTGTWPSSASKLTQTLYSLLMKNPEL
jgi:starch synthase